MIKFRKDYPVILLAADEKTNTDELRHELSGSGIYFHTSDFNGVKENIDTVDIIIIYSPIYSSPAKALTDYVSDNAKNAIIIYVGEPYDINESERVTVLPPMPDTAVSELMTILKETFKIDPSYAEDEEIVCALGKPAQVYYNGTKLLLSKSEAKIVHFLLTVEPKMLVPKETIGEYLALAPGAVPVPIHNINDKSMKTYHDKLIFSRSSRGYFVY